MNNVGWDIVRASIQPQMTMQHANAGLLVELDALGGVLEGSQEWQPDAKPVRSRQLRILSLVASRYLSAGASIAYGNPLT